MDLFLIRHAHAGTRSSHHHDDYRPLSDRGWARSAELDLIFAKVKISRILSSPATRCVQTVEGIAKSHGLEIAEHPDLAEGSDIPDVIKLLEKKANKPTILCSHGDIIPALIDLLGNNGVPIKGRGCEKGSVWIVSHDGREFTGARHLPKKADKL